MYVLTVIADSVYMRDFINLCLILEFTLFYIPRAELQWWDAYLTKQHLTCSFPPWRFCIRFNLSLSKQITKQCRCIPSFKGCSFSNIRCHSATLCGHSASGRFMTSLAERFICGECVKLQCSAVFCPGAVREMDPPLLWEIKKLQKGVIPQNIASTKTQQVLKRFEWLEVNKQSGGTSVVKQRNSSEQTMAAFEEPWKLKDWSWKVCRWLQSGDYTLSSALIRFVLFCCRVVRFADLYKDGVNGFILNANMLCILQSSFMVAVY